MGGISIEDDVDCFLNIPDHICKAKKFDVFMNLTCVVGLVHKATFRQLFGEAIFILWQPTVVSYNLIMYSF